MIYYYCMKNINTNKLIKGLQIVFILVVGIFSMPSSSYAAVNYVWGNLVDIAPVATPPPSYPQNYYQNYQVPNNYNYTTAAPAPYYPAPAYNNYNNPAPAPAPDYSNAPTIKSNDPVVKAPATKTVAKATTPKTTNVNAGDYVLVPKSQLLAVNSAQVAGLADVNTADANSLTANSLFAGSFIPHGLLGWVFIAIFILIIIILARKVFGKTKAYMASPSKHD